MSKKISVTNPKVIVDDRQQNDPSSSNSQSNDLDKGYMAGLRGEPNDEDKSPDWKMGWTEAQE
jgi:hypothetical protein